MIRFFDVLISIILLIFFLPLIITIALIILLIYGRPIIYSQLRVGYKGREFNILKFRTMINNKLLDENLRVTSFGKILRKTSLDELPQFINVLKKEMSIVGPRPLPSQIEKNINRNYRLKRRNILPGLTGFSQINYTGKHRKLHEKTELDILLVNNYTLHNYFKILLKTPIVLVRRLIKNKTSIIK